MSIVKNWSERKIIGYGLCMLLLGALWGTVVGHGIATGYLQDHAQQAATEAMFKTIQPLDAKAVAILQKQAAASGNPAIMLAARKLYIATADVTLAPVDEPMAIILPQGKQWVGGELGRITLLRARTDLKYVDKSFPFYDVICQGEVLGMTPQGSCNDPRSRFSGKADEMASHMRRPTEAELKKWLDKNDPKSVNEYWVATSNFFAAPDYRTAEPGKQTLTIFLPDGVKMLGGQLGYTDVLRVSGGEVVRGYALYDNLCYYNGRGLTENETQSIAQPATFAPLSAIERVSNCNQK